MNIEKPKTMLPIILASLAGIVLVLVACVGCAVGGWIMFGSQTTPAIRSSGDDRAYLLEPLRSPVRSIAVSPDGKTVAAGCHDGAIHQWDLETGQAGPVLSGHRGIVSALAFSPDGKSIISGSHDRTILVWDVKTGHESKRLAGHDVAIWSLAIAPAGDVVASVGPYDLRDLPVPGDVRVWDLANARAKDLGDLQVKKAGITSIAFGTDGKGIFIASTDGGVWLWDLATKKDTKSFNGHIDSVWSMALSRDGKLLATGDESGAVVLWDVETAMQRKVIPNVAGIRDPIQSMAFVRDGSVLATVARDRTIRFWDTANGQLLSSVTDNDSHPSRIAFTPDGKKLVCGRAQYDELQRPLVGDTKVWDVDRVLGR